MRFIAHTSGGTRAPSCPTPREASFTERRRAAVSPVLTPGVLRRRGRDGAVPRARWETRAEPSSWGEAAFAPARVSRVSIPRSRQQPRGRIVAEGRPASPGPGFRRATMAPETLRRPGPGRAGVRRCHRRCRRGAREPLREARGFSTSRGLAGLSSLHRQNGTIHIFLK